MATTKVKSVTDGDTFVGTGDIVYRLEGVDTPEKGEPKYQEAKDYLTRLIDGEIVSIVEKATDDYGRKIVQVTFDGESINKKVKNKFG